MPPIEESADSDMDDDEVEAVKTLIVLSGSILRKLRRPTAFRSLTGRLMRADGLWEVTVYADDTVMTRLIGADATPEQDITAAVDEYDAAREEGA